MLAVVVVVVAGSACDGGSAPQGTVRSAEQERGIEFGPMTAHIESYWTTPGRSTVLVTVGTAPGSVGERLQIVETADSVGIDFKARAPASSVGSQFHTLTVQLAEPFGDRVLRDERGYLVERSDRRPSRSQPLISPAEIVRE